LTSEGGSEVATLSALEQYDCDQEKANDYVDYNKGAYEFNAMRHR